MSNEYIKRVKSSKRKPFVSTRDNTELHTWFERDRAHVELRHTRTQKTILEFWDEDVSQAIEDGFLRPGAFHDSLIEYANYLDMRPHD